jgi:phenylacetate-CoA ligase
MDARVMASEPHETITDADRYPTLTEHGRALLRSMREHPNAPIYRNESGNRLTPADVERVRAFEREVLAATVGWRSGELPSWLDELVDHCFREVPFYRRHGARPARFTDLPTISRANLGDIAQFVPDSAPLDRLINFRTSGTTGHPLLLASHPVVAASYLAFHKRALRRFGIDLRYGRGQVGNVLIGHQRHCFTYVSVTPTMDESGLAKINLHPSDWRDPDDRARYIDALAPEVIAGDPLSFAELLRLTFVTRPRALLSTSMRLSHSLSRALEERFGCPVLDLYSLNEAGPVAVYDGEAGGHVLLQHRMYIEILDADGNPVAAGERGEITLSGGFNFCLPLLRYRTGDYASLRLDAPEPVLVGLEGRAPVRFRTMRGEWINNIEITHVMRQFPVSQFTVHQDATGALVMRVAGWQVAEPRIREALLGLFGAGQPADVAVVDGFDGKIVQYTSALEGASP